MLAPTSDVELFRFFNQPGGPILDGVMWAASSRGVLLAVLGALALAAWRRSPHGLLAATLLLVAVGVADLTAVRVLKWATARARPCQALEAEGVRAPFGCGSGSSFPSAHASNAMAAAAVTSWALPQAGPLAVLGAFLVGTSRLYLGVHWPTDVLAGWLLGALVGWLAIQAQRLRLLRPRRR